MRHQLGPGIFQQVQMHCDRCVTSLLPPRLPSLPPLTLLPFLHPRPCRCGGRGQTIKHYCPFCKGARIVDTVSDLDLHIDRGMPEGEEIVFEGEADESPDLEAGDVVVRVRSKKEKGGFVRKDSNLYWKEPISVAEVRGPIGRLQTKMSFGRICLLAVLGRRHCSGSGILSRASTGTTLCYPERASRSQVSSRRFR